MIRFLDRISVILMIGVLFWLAVPSKIFLKDISLTVDDRRVKYIRETPYGDVDAMWRAEITLINGDNFECTSGEWKVATYQAVRGNTVSYDLGSWAEPCLEYGPPYYLTITRHVLLFGVIPLRPMKQTTEILDAHPDIEIFIVPQEM